MAFCTDSGSVGVVDLQTDEITRMKQSHANVCASSVRGRFLTLISRCAVQSDLSQVVRVNSSVRGMIMLCCILTSCKEACFLEMT